MIKADHTKKFATCPRCGDAGCNRHSIKKIVRDNVEHIKSVHHCPECMKYFTVGPNFQWKYHRDVIDAAVKIATRRGLTLEKASYAIRAEMGKRIPVATLHEWVHKYRTEQLDKLFGDVG